MRRGRRGWRRVGRESSGELIAGLSGAGVIWAMKYLGRCLVFEMKISRREI